MAKATEIDIEARAKAGRENFLKGYNCAQSVIAAFADIYPSDERLHGGLAPQGGRERVDVVGACA